MHCSTGSRTVESHCALRIRASKAHQATTPHPKKPARAMPPCVCACALATVHEAHARQGAAREVLPVCLRGRGVFCVWVRGCVVCVCPGHYAPALLTKRSMSLMLDIASLRFVAELPRRVLQVEKGQPECRCTAQQAVAPGAWLSSARALRRRLAARLAARASCSPDVAEHRFDAGELGLERVEV